MAQVESCTEGSHTSVSSLNGTEVKDRLWEFQLRKENKALLSELRANEQKRLEDQKEFEQRHKAVQDRMTLFEAEVVDLGRKVKEGLQARERFVEDIAALKVLVEENITKSFSEEDAHYILTAGNGRYPIGSVSSTPTRSPQPDRRPVDPRHRHAMKVARRQPSREEENLFARPPPGPIQRPQRHQRPQKPQGQVKAPVEAGPSNYYPPSNPRRPATRSQARDEISSANISKPTDAMSVPPSISKASSLNQNHKSMKDYYLYANNIYQTSRGLENDTRFEVDFVSAFLRGTKVQKTKDKLVDELRQRYPSRTTRGGSVEVICAWADIEAALSRAGLLPDHRVANKRQGLYMDPRGMAETDI